MQRQAFRKDNLRPVSLRTSGGARTVLLRMAADQERADRIRALKLGRPDLTWRRIAEHVGVTERSATDWGKKGGMEYENAVKLAALFEVDVDYLWRGTAGPTPDPFETQLDRLERNQGEILARLTGLAQALGFNAEVQRVVDDWRAGRLPALPPASPREAEGNGSTGNRAA